jgi:ferric-dicitrate binding protein FerR (iron transport regulator)
MKEDWENRDGEYTIDDAQSNILYERIVADPRFKLIKKRADKPVFSIRVLTGIAAGVLVFLCVGFIINYYLKRAPQQKEIVYQEKTVPLGQKIQIELSDGTVIWLNSGSRLKVPLNFIGDKRELYLQGEAYFDVAHDASKPFIIHTGNVITQVMGTAFNIKAYGSFELDVTVARGKVSVGLKNRQLGVLTSNRGLSYDSRNNLTKQYYTNAAKVRWMYGDLIFDNIKMEEAVKTLERWYNIKITVSDPKVKAYRFTASFLNHENIDQVLKVLSELTHFNYSQQGKSFIIQAQ